ncbi:hypothetical protein [Pseudomonas sp. GZD-222]|uniref:hypothetical protein n=1 Tax=Pseudomonas sp. GZD-222 TaxID=3404805 RepID=UPI003BB81130
MAGKVEIFVGLVGKADKNVGIANAGTSVIDQYTTDKKGFELVNQSAQTGVSVVATVTSIVQLTKGFVPFLNIQTNALAGTMMFLKITAEYKGNTKFKTGDAVSLVGNVAGIAAGITLLVAGPGLAASAFVAAGVVTSLYGIFTSEAVTNFFNSTVLPVWNQNFKNKPSATYPDYWVAPDLKLVPLAEIIARYGNQVAVSHWDPRVNTVKVSRGLRGGGASGSVPGGSYAGGSVMPPLVIPRPERPSENIDIFIESINGQPQDGYGCCSGSQDGYH